MNTAQICYKSEKEEGKMTTELRNLLYTTSVFGLITLGSLYSYNGLPVRDTQNHSAFIAQQNGTTGQQATTVRPVERVPQKVSTPTATGSDENVNRSDSKTKTNTRTDESKASLKKDTLK